MTALAVFDDGSGPALYAAGDFFQAGRHIAKWDGRQWSALGSGMGPSIYSHVDALAVFDDGSGHALYAGGLFTTAGGRASSSIAAWHWGTLVLIDA